MKDGRMTVVLLSLPSASCLTPLTMRRPERVADTIREEISQIVGFELEDPRLTMVTVTDVRLSDNLRDARVYVTIAGDETEHREALSALSKAAPYVRKQLGLSLNLPRTPEIHFVTRSSRRKRRARGRVAARAWKKKG